MEVEFSEFEEVPMEVDRRVWRKVRRRIGDPTKEGLSRGGGSSSPPLSGQPTGPWCRRGGSTRLSQLWRKYLCEGGLELKLMGAMGWDTIVVQD